MELCFVNIVVIYYVRDINRIIICCDNVSFWIVGIVGMNVIDIFFSDVLCKWGGVFDL